jgi:hypothetical protein
MAGADLDAGLRIQQRDLVGKIAPLTAELHELAAEFAIGHVGRGARAFRSLVPAIFGLASHEGESGAATRCSGRRTRQNAARRRDAVMVLRLSRA